MTMMMGFALLLLSFCGLLGAVQAGAESKPTHSGFRIPGFSSLQQETSKAMSSFFEDDDEDETITAKIWPSISAVGTTLYGTSLLLSSNTCSNQIHLMTMMRATGFQKIENGMKLAKENFRQAIRSAVWHAPSFVMAAQSIMHLQDRVHESRQTMSQARKARAKGEMTERELRRIKKMQQRNIREFQKDMKRLMKAGGSIQTFIKVLDFDEIMDVVRGFLFQLMAVLASGHNDSRIGKFISRWCLMLNLGSLILDTNGKLEYPIARFIVTNKAFSKDLGGEKEKQISNIGKAIVFSTSFYLSYFKTTVARELNTALLGAAVILRGIRSFAVTLWDRKHGDENAIWGQLASAMEGKIGGGFMISVASIGFCLQRAAKRGELKAPNWMKYPMEKAENVVGKIAVLIDKIV